MQSAHSGRCVVVVVMRGLLPHGVEFGQACGYGRAMNKTLLEKIEERIEAELLDFNYDGVEQLLRCRILLLEHPQEDQFVAAMDRLRASNHAHAAQVLEGLQQVGKVGLDESGRVEIK